jgi:hypothetical protein
VGAGAPLATTVKLPGVPTVNVVLLALANTGAACTTRLKFWIADVPTPFAAVSVTG